MIGAFLLSEAGAGHRHDSSFVHHLHAVDEVWLFAQFLTVINKFLREVNLREAVHSSFDLCARDLRHIVKGIGQELSSLFQVVKDFAPLFVVEIDALH